MVVHQADGGRPHAMTQHNVQDNVIAIDLATGRITGAKPHEWLALTALRWAVRLMMPFHLFGFSYVCRLVRMVLPSRRKMVFDLGHGSRMLTDYCDAYWSVLLLPGFPYEPENMALMNGCRDINYGFIDGGANHGLWAIRVAGDAGGRKPVVAVEAASDTFKRLELNNALNGNRFVALNRAIGATTGEPVKIYGAKHERRSIVAPDAAARPILDTVTVSLDDLAKHDAFAGVKRFVVKLDVEGVEIAAISAAKRLQAGETVFVYEDHGSDRQHETTRHVMETLGMRVFWLGREAAAGEITDVRQMDAIKKSHRFGYDFVASKSPFWIEQLTAIIEKRAPADRAAA
jgi:FkbM family methyltransferase